MMHRNKGKEMNESKIDQVHCNQISGPPNSKNDPYSDDRNGTRDMEKNWVRRAEKSTRK
jgi:hypothetical protein